MSNRPSTWIPIPLASHFEVEVGQKFFGCQTGDLAEVVAVECGIAELRYESSQVSVSVPLFGFLGSFNSSPPFGYGRIRNQAWYTERETGDFVEIIDAKDDVVVFKDFRGKSKSISALDFHLNYDPLVSASYWCCPANY